MVILGFMLTLTRLLTSHAAMGSLLQSMAVWSCCSAGIWFSPSGTEWYSAHVGSVKFHSSLAKRWGIWTWWAQIETVDMILLFFYFSFSSISSNFTSLILVMLLNKKKIKTKPDAKTPNENNWSPVFCYTFWKCQEVMVTVSVAVNL